jgi:hypothetical protein
MDNASADFFAGGIKPAQFPQYGATVTGKITDMTQSQQTEPSKIAGQPGKPKTWDDGSPAMQLVVTLATQERDDEEDDGLRRIYIKGQMKAAMQAAIKAVGAKQLDLGGTVTVTYTHDGERTNPAFSPPKQYAVQYVPPNASAGFLGAGTGTGNGTVSAIATAVQPAEQIPAGLTPEIWATMSPEAKAALAALNK